MRNATRRFSTLALASVIVLICTGLNNAWNLVGGFAPLFGTDYGKLLLVKLGLLVSLLAIGSILSPVVMWGLLPASKLAGWPMADHAAAVKPKILRAHSNIRFREQGL